MKCTIRIILVIGLCVTRIHAMEESLVNQEYLANQNGAAYYLSDESLQLLYENPADHPAMYISNKEKKTLYGDMPNRWIKQATIKHDHWVSSVDFSKDGTWIVTASSDGNVKIADVLTNNVIHTINHQRWVALASVSSDKKWLMSVLHGGPIVITELETGNKIREIEHEGAKLAKFLPDDKWVLSHSWYGNDGRIKITKIDDKSNQHVIEHAGSVSSIECSPAKSVECSLDGKFILTAGYDGVITILDLATNMVVRELYQKDSIMAASFFPGNRLIMALHEGKIDIVDLATWTVAKQMHFDQHIARPTCFSPDKKWVLRRSHDDMLRLTKIETGQERCIQGMRWLWDVAFSPDSSKFVTIAHRDDSYRKIATIWDTYTGKELFNIYPHQYYDMSAVSFSPDSKKIATASQDQTAQVFEQEASTFDEALLVHLLQWCRKNNKNIHASAWIRKALETCDQEKMQRIYYGTKSAL